MTTSDSLKALALEYRLADVRCEVAEAHMKETRAALAAAEDRWAAAVAAKASAQEALLEAARQLHHGHGALGISSCPCRLTSSQPECAAAGCGYCAAAQVLVPR